MHNAYSAKVTNSVLGQLHILSVDAPYSCCLLASLPQGLFVIALPGEVTICLFFWFLAFDGTVQCISLMLHRLGILIAAIDGFLINWIPIRTKKFYLFETFAALYLIWNTVFLSPGLVLGNPYKESGAQDDNVMYSCMIWKTNSASAVTTALHVCLVANTILFLLCWVVSWMLPMRLYVWN